MITEHILRSATSGGKLRRIIYGDHMDLSITNTGTKTLYCRYTKDKKECRFCLGHYPDEIPSLAEALRLRDQFFRENGITPLTHGREIPSSEESEGKSRTGVVVRFEDVELNLNTSFHDAFMSWFRNVYQRKVIEKTQKATLSAFRMHINPVLGDKKIGKITAGIITNALNTLVATPCLQIIACSIISRVFQYLYMRDVVSFNPAFGLSEMYKSKDYEVEHRASLPYHRLPELLHRFLSAEDVTLEIKLLFLFSLCSLLRPSENVSLEWSFVSLSAQTITIPSEVMKMKREFRVPITPFILRILMTMRRLRFNLKNPYVFYGLVPMDTLGSIGRSTMSRIFKNCFHGELCPHGLRAMGRGWMVDNQVPWDIAEMMLSHKISNAVAAAYIRTDYLEQRRYWIDKWCQYILKQDTHHDIEKMFQQVGELIDNRIKSSPVMGADDIKNAGKA